MYIKEFILDVIFHSIRVAFYSVLEGYKYRLSITDLLILLVASLFHDVGKFCVNKEILFSNEIFNPAIRDFVRKTHVEYSVIIARAFLKNRLILMLIENHHNKDITINEKIFSLYKNNTTKKEDLMIYILRECDRYDAIKSKRSYKSKIDKKQAELILSVSL